MAFYLSQTLKSCWLNKSCCGSCSELVACTQSTAEASPWQWVHHTRCPAAPRAAEAAGHCPDRPSVPPRRTVPKFMKRSKAPDYRDKAVFGVPPIINVQRTGQPLPQSIQQAMRYLRSQCLDQVTPLPRTLGCCWAALFVVFVVFIVLWHRLSVGILHLSMCPWPSCSRAFVWHGQAGAGPALPRVPAWLPVPPGRHFP